MPSPTNTPSHHPHPTHNPNLHRNPPLQHPPLQNLTLQTPPPIPPHQRLQRPHTIERQLPLYNLSTTGPSHRLRRERHKHHDDLAVRLVCEQARLRAALIDDLVLFVVGPEPSDDRVAGVEGGLLAFEAGVVG